MAVPGQLQYVEKTDIYSWFETDDFPTESQFRATWDSYWHKSEKLPMASITGLVEKFNNTVSTATYNNHLNDENAHSTFLAKIDASNLSQEHVTTWKTKLGVGQLPPNIATVDYMTPDGWLVGNAYKKIASPGDGKTYLLNISGTATDASAFGKIDKVMGVSPDVNKNVDISGIAMTWTNQHRFSNIPDKKADLTYSNLVGVDAQGNLAKVGYGALKGSFSELTQTQALELGQLLNGGQGSAGAMSVNLISPPIVQKIDSNEYIMLQGVNLNLSATAKRIEIIDAVTKAVVITIPDSQIQLYADGLSLIFYYNFKNLAFGNYLIRLTSGVKIYETTLELKVVQNVNNINLDLITWNAVYDSTVTPNATDSFVGRNIAINTPVGASMVGAIPKIAIKSSEVFAQGQDFYIEIKVNLGAKSNANADVNRSYIGVGYSSTPNTLAPNALVNSNFYWHYNSGMYINNNTIIGSAATASPYEYTVIIIKTGNLFRTIIGTMNHAVTLSNNSGYSIFLDIVGRASAQIIQAQLTKAYTFN